MTDDSAPRALIRIAGLSKRFGDVPAVDDLSLDVRAGEFFCLLGPSGCGKSTLLRLIAGFETPDSGSIALDGRDLAGEPPHRRPLNVMFQSYALFPHLSVHGNVAYGLKREGRPRAEIAERVAAALRLVRLEGLGARKPAELSGGQKQRVALARALVKRPRVLLLDEPLGALDRSLREATQRELKALQAELGTTFVTVTHDGEEASLLADRIGVMEAGRLVQVGSPRELYERPRTRFVAGVLGDVNLLAGRVAAVRDGLARVEAPGFPAGLEAALRGDEPRPAIGPATVAVRPERVRVGPADAAGAVANEATGLVAGCERAGAILRTIVRLPDGTLLRSARLEDGAPTPRRGAAVRVAFPADAATLLP